MLKFSEIRSSNYSVDSAYLRTSVRINSGYDEATSSQNLVNFCLVPPEMAVLFCERQVRHGQKTGVFCRIYPDILEAFSQCFNHMNYESTLRADGGSVPNFPIYQGTLP